MKQRWKSNKKSEKRNLKRIYHYEALRKREGERYEGLGERSRKSAQNTGKKMKKI